MTLNKRDVYLPDIIGKGYGEFFRFKGRYLVVKGSRASKKSKTSAIKIIYNMMKYKGANTLVVRKTYRTLKDSCFMELKWAVKRLGVEYLWEEKLSPLEMTYKPTGQKIYFRGLDDPLKVTSITVEKGSLCFGWLEEAYEVTKEEDFNILDESIRGKLPRGLFKQWIITFNPWNEHHWLKKRFFDIKDDDILPLTTTYKCNEWLDNSDIKLFEDMKKNNPRRYQVAGLGNWGIIDGLIYENFEEKAFELKDIINFDTISGLDFGYTNDPTAFFIGFIDKKDKRIFIWDELYEKGLSNKMIYERIRDMGYKKEKITADSAEPKSIDELRNYGLKVRASLKGKDSIMHGIQFLQNYKIIIHPRCVNFLMEISNYTWDKDKFGNKINSPVDDFNHLMDALRYSVEKYHKKVTYKEIKGGI